jgi:hypothetical protein
MFGKNPPFEKVEPNPIPKGKVDFLKRFCSLFRKET